MTRCRHCKAEVVGEYVRLENGSVLSTGEVIRSDTNLHPACYGPYMLAHYPWLATSYTRDRTRVD